LGRFIEKELQILYLKGGVGEINACFGVTLKMQMRCNKIAKLKMAATLSTSPESGRSTNLSRKDVQPALEYFYVDFLFALINLLGLLACTEILHPP
jgi:hypothetical protein